MNKLGYIVVAGAVVLAAVFGVVTSFAAEQTRVVSAKEVSQARTVLEAVALPKVENPEWLDKQLEAEKQQQAATSPSSGTRTFTYDVSTRGVVSANFAEFQTLANQTLNDPRGWARMGVKFVQVPSGGSFTLVLSEASQLPSFSSGCSAEYSCRVGRYVVINQDRWQGATPSWNNAGGSLRDYRHMVINHETGHWLGHGHVSCGGSGQPAPVMQQQSMNLQGCSFNAWPLNSELTTSR